jgi:hypothetical protein
MPVKPSKPATATAIKSFFIVSPPGYICFAVIFAKNMWAADMPLA